MPASEPGFSLKFGVFWIPETSEVLRNFLKTVTGAAFSEIFFKNFAEGVRASQVAKIFKIFLGHPRASLHKKSENFEKFQNFHFFGGGNWGKMAVLSGNLPLGLPTPRRQQFFKFFLKNLLFFSDFFAIFLKWLASGVPQAGTARA